MSPSLLLVPALLLGESSVPKPVLFDPSMTVAYFPMRIGTKLVYDEGRSERTLVVASVRKGPTGRVISLDLVLPGGRTVPDRKVIVSEAGLFLAEIFGQPIDPPSHELKLPVKTGEKWLTGGGWEAVIVGKERIEVPAGRYTALRVEWSKPGSLGGKPRVTFWYAPGIGEIKSAAGERVLRVLKSYTPPK
jgi:hypothetical protein